MCLRPIKNLLAKLFPQFFGEKLNMTLNFEGFIKDVQYKAFLTEDLSKYDYKNFNINEVILNEKKKLYAN